jgi:hypothetical protein
VGQIGYFNKYHKQIIASLQTPTYSSMYSSPGQTAEGYGMPWTNIETFSEDQPDNRYPYRTDFDDLFEQVHDNFHGWVGTDKVRARSLLDSLLPQLLLLLTNFKSPSKIHRPTNIYTAFDPIFYSYHANMDRRLLGI